MYEYLLNMSDKPVIVKSEQQNTKQVESVIYYSS